MVGDHRAYGKSNMTPPTNDIDINDTSNAWIWNKDDIGWLCRCCGSNHHAMSCAFRLLAEARDAARAEVTAVENQFGAFVADMNESLISMRAQADVEEIKFRDDIGRLTLELETTSERAEALADEVKVLLRDRAYVIQDRDNCVQLLQQAAVNRDRLQTIIDDDNAGKLAEEVTSLRENLVVQESLAESWYFDFKKMETMADSTVIERDAAVKALRERDSVVALLKAQVTDFSAACKRLIAKCEVYQDGYRSAGDVAKALRAKLVKLAEALDGVTIRIENQAEEDAFNRVQQALEEAEME